MSNEDTQSTPATGKATSNNDEIIDLHEEIDEVTALSRMFWNGNFPQAQGIIAKRLATASIPIQLMQFSTLSELLEKNPEDKKNVAMYAKNTTFVYHLPGNERKLRVIHTVEDITKDGTTMSNNNLVALSGEFEEEIQFPNIHQLKLEDFKSEQFKTPSQEEYIKAIVSMYENGGENNATAFKFNKSSLNEVVELARVQAIPPYLVYDALEDGIDSIRLYERIHHVIDETPNINGAKHFRRLLAFLQVGLVTPTSKNNICLPPEQIWTKAPKEALLWRRNKLKMYKLLEALVQQESTETRDDEAKPAPKEATMAEQVETRTSDESMVPLSSSKTIIKAAKKAGLLKNVTEESDRKRPRSPPPPMAPATPEATPSSPDTPDKHHYKETATNRAAARAPTFVAGTAAAPEMARATMDNTLQFNEGTFIQLLKLIRLNDAGSGAEAVSAPAGKFETLGLPESAFKNLLTLCGLTLDLRKEIPEMWMRLGETGLNKADKNNIIRHALQNNTMYKNCKVPLIQPIFTMIRDRTFEGEYTVSSLTAAVKGLSPFIVPFLTQSQIDESNKLNENIALATSIKPQDIAGNRMSCTLPQSYDHMIKQLKRFTNLVYALFGESSPLVQALEVVINELEDQTEVAIAKISKENIASILWIIMLQSRHFAAGQMIPADPYIASFQVLINNLEMKNIHNISHGEVPPELYTPKIAAPSIKRNRNEQEDQQQQNEEQRRKRLATEKNKVETWMERPEIYNPKVKSDMATIKSMKPRPTITKLCKAAGTSSLALFPNHPKVCIRSQIWGACEKDCPHQHILLPDAEIDHVRDQLKKVVNNPALLRNKV